MAILDNAVWLTGAGGTAADGTTIVTDGTTSTSTTVTGTFTVGVWDDSQTGYNISEFGAFGQTAPVSMQYEFSNDVTDLSFISTTSVMTALQPMTTNGPSTSMTKTVFLYRQQMWLPPCLGLLMKTSM